ncbi:MAG: hypothetical protein RXQ00_09485 [Caldivirga sp.]
MKYGKRGRVQLRLYIYSEDSGIVLRTLSDGNVRDGSHINNGRTDQH